VEENLLSNYDNVIVLPKEILHIYLRVYETYEICCKIKDNKNLSHIW